MSFLLSEVKQKESENHLKRLHEQEKEIDIWLSFSMIDKYGININLSDQKTPLEIYGYLLRDFFQHYGNDIRKLPFGINRPCEINGNE